MSTTTVQGTATGATSVSGDHRAVPAFARHKEDSDGHSFPEVEPALSLIVPVYNESRRIARCLNTALAQLDRLLDSFELLVVDDGSDDDTVRIAMDIVGNDPRVRILSIPHGGKALAVRAGMEVASGKVIAFSDVDLATPLSYLDALCAEIHAGAGIAIGSREGLGAQRLDEPAHRHVMGRVFNLMVQVLLLPGINDTQCGFKALSQAAIADVLRESRLYRRGDTVTGPRVTAFDVEMLYIARRYGHRIASVPVVWSAGSDSKVSAVSDTWINARDVLRVRLNAWRGRYGDRSVHRRAF